jgi:hypothetical protein
MTTRHRQSYGTIRICPMVDVPIDAPRPVLAERLRASTARRAVLEASHEAACAFAAARGRYAPLPSATLLALRLECELIARALAEEAVP